MFTAVVTAPTTAASRRVHLGRMFMATAHHPCYIGHLAVDYKSVGGWRPAALHPGEYPPNHHLSR
eukprot:COSAG01_NODE_72361_length_253_cov_0.675325_1_plen_64_part_01